MERDFCGGEEERKRKAEGIPTTGRDGEVRKREMGIKKNGKKKIKCGKKRFD